VDFFFVQPTEVFSSTEGYPLQCPGRAPPFFACSSLPLARVCCVPPPPRLLPSIFQFFEIVTHKSDAKQRASSVLFWFSYLARGLQCVLILVFARFPFLLPWSVFMKTGGTHNFFLHGSEPSPLRFAQTWPLCCCCRAFSPQSLALLASLRLGF